MRRSAAAVIVAGIVLLAACSSEPTIEIDEGSMQRLDSSPLDEFYTSVYGQVQMSESEEAAQQRTRQMREADLTAECMAAQGFTDYIPWFPGMSLSPAVPEDTDSLDPMEQARQWGYGVFTRTDLSSADDPAAYIDPNQAVMEQMSEDERAAFLKALVEGDGSGPDENGKLDQADGCLNWANEEVNKVDPQWERAAAAFSDPRFAELDRAIQDIPVAIAESTSLAAANQTWSDCMADAGYDHDSPEWAEAYFSDLGSEIESRVSDEAQNAASEEIATAVADQQCRADSDYDQTVQQITWNIEKQVLDRYADDITALSDNIAQSS